MQNMKNIINVKIVNDMNSVNFDVLTKYYSLSSYTKIRRQMDSNKYKNMFNNIRINTHNFKYVL
jgi:hypothetical protein